MHRIRRTVKMVHQMWYYKSNAPNLEYRKTVYRIPYRKNSASNSAYCKNGALLTIIGSILSYIIKPSRLSIIFEKLLNNIFHSTMRVFFGNSVKQHDLPMKLKISQSFSAHYSAFCCIKEE